MNHPKPFVTSLRKTRPWHRYLGLFLVLFILISSITGILLSWKKQWSWLQPKETKLEKVPTMQEWLPLHVLIAIGTQHINQTQSDSVWLDRIDIRPNKGFAKMLFQPGDWEIQIQGNSGLILSSQKRPVDWIERLHDGSIISEGFKLVSMSGLGLGLMILSLTGFWLWLGPKLVKRNH